MNENSAWLKEQRQKAQLEAERRYAEQSGTESAAPEPPAAAPRPPAKDRRGWKTRTCSICRAAGLIDEAAGHIAAGHDSWLARQPADVKAHFKGQGKTAARPPRLVKPTGEDDGTR